jgi:adenosylhomocysteine nucleosidase
MSRIAIIAALPGELKPLVRDWSGKSAKGVNVWRHGEGPDEWIAACAGMGAAPVLRAWNEITKEGSIDVLFSIGWAGALREEFAAGRAYNIAGVIDAESGERIRTSDTSEDTWLVTSPRVADRAEKARLASAYGAGLVDMEAFGLARVAAQHSIPFYCIKGVSDGPQDRLPDFNRFISVDHHFRLTRFIFFAFLRPWLWPSLMSLGEHSNHAARNIRQLLLAALEKRQIATASGNPPHVKS